MMRARDASIRFRTARVTAVAFAPLRLAALMVTADSLGLFFSACDTYCVASP